MRSGKGRSFLEWIWQQATLSSAQDHNMETDQKDENENDGVVISDTSLNRAKLVIDEIESIIQQELASIDQETFLQENLEPREPSSPLGKRPAPKLIKPLNKKKNRMVLGEMEFDPIRNVWLGNDDATSIFDRKGPALIQNINQFKTETHVGEMTFDPEEQIWKGNEKALSKFNSKLITYNNTINEAIVGDMTFDPERMIWVGNDDELDIFSDIESANSDSRVFTVGKEFSLTNEMKEAFRKREKEHKDSLRGWFAEERIPSVGHLYSIRNMSISRIISQARNTQAVPETPKVPAPPKEIVISEGEDWDKPTTPVSPRSQPNSPHHSPHSHNDQKDNNNKNNNDKEKKGGKLKSLSQFADSDDFDDIEITDKLVVKNRIVDNTTTIPDDNLKFVTSSEDEERVGSQQEQPNDEEWSGLQLPQGTLRLKRQQKEHEALNSIEFDSENDLEKEDRKETESSPDQMDSKRIEVEDWSDVDIPTSDSSWEDRKRKNLKNDKPTLSRKDSEEWSDVELPTAFNLPKRPLAFSTNSDHDKSDFSEDEWSDFDLPPNAIDRLKEKIAH
eukprot:TRINITY_DN6250_c0_g1_i1.p1 TRINITY_DN6250_c0_g1~~TRINITY_DN6250_c0_g1_i1.p1  ORF type:complete len:561 (+),score=147.86 TRINITY_DN6250_c0_g1_i1:89-1771(+)